MDDDFGFQPDADSQPQPQSQAAPDNFGFQADADSMSSAATPQATLGSPQKINRLQADALQDQLEGGWRPEKVIPAVANAIISPVTSLAGKVYNTDKDLFTNEFPNASKVIGQGVDALTMPYKAAGKYVANVIDNSPTAQTLINGPVVQAGIDTAKIAGSLPILEGASAIGLPALSKITPDVVGGVRTIAKGAPALDSDLFYKTADEIKGNLYNNKNIATTEISQDAGNGLSKVVSNIIPNQQTKAGQSLYSKTAQAVSNLQDDIANGHLSLSNIDQHRQILGNIGKDITNPNKAQEAAAASRVIDALDDHLNTLGQGDLQNGTTEGIDALNQARAAYAKSKTYERIADLVDKSGGDDVKLQRLVSNFASNEKNLLGMNQDERDALDQAANPGPGQSTLAALGKLSPFQKNPIGALASGSLLSSVSTPLGAAAVGSGAIARPLAKAMTRGNVRNLLETIEGRPLPDIATPMEPPPPPQRLLPSPNNMSALPMTAEQIAVAQAQNRASSGATGSGLPINNNGSAEVGNITPQNQRPLLPAPGNLSALPANPTQVSQAQAGIRAASGETGGLQVTSPTSGNSTNIVPPRSGQDDFLSKVRNAESGKNPNAKNPNSTASGPYQFTNGTWNDMVNKYGKQTGITKADKSDPAAQHTMAALYARDNAQQLSSALGRDPNPGEVYMAHVFGPTGATKLITAADTPIKAKDIFPANVVKANRGLFFDKIRPRSAAEVYSLLDSKVS